MRELCECLTYQPILSYAFKKPGHINTLEMRSWKTLMKVLSKAHPGSKILIALDSRTTMGANARGRSSSPALIRIQQGALGYIIGGGLYPGTIHFPSADFRADDPSRGKRIRPPSRTYPLWLTELEAGRDRAFEIAVEADMYEDWLCHWLRLLIRLCGDVHPHP